MNQTQILMISLLAALLAITHFLSSSLRPTYLYCIFNLVIIRLAVEAGFLSVLSKPLEDIRPVVSVAIKPLVESAAEVLQEAKATALELSEKTKATALELSEKTKAALKVIEKSLAEKVARDVNKVEVKKFPSLPIPSLPFPSLPIPALPRLSSLPIPSLPRLSSLPIPPLPRLSSLPIPPLPSLFFIGGGESEAEEVAAEQEEEEVEFEGEEEEEEAMVRSGQELFTKAEIFIENFYKQLKIQKEEPWKKKIHEVSQKAF